MIVRDEAHILARCLTAVRPLVQSALIVDTGSADGTVALARAFLHDADLPGEILEEPWRDFAFNRSHALAELRRRQPEADYALMIDADDEVVLTPAETLALQLSADIGTVVTRMGVIVYRRPQIISNRKPFYFKGTLHEYLECDEPFSKQSVHAFEVRSLQDSARNVRPDKYIRDTQTLEQALLTETDDYLRTRYTFYLAQTLSNAGDLERALVTYLKRAELGGPSEEIFVSLLQAGRLCEALGRHPDEAMAHYERATPFSPARVEARHGAARLHRLHQRHIEGCAAAEPALAATAPPEGLFVEPWIYDYGLKDEFAVCAFWAGKLSESLAVCIDLLSLHDLPQSERSRIASNARYAMNGLTQKTAPPD